MTARVIPIRRVVHEPCAPSMANGYRAEIIRAAAAGDQQRIKNALEAWNEHG